jgi:hypothetical protein
MPFMDGEKIFALPARDPVSGGALVITELEGPETGITIRGRFEMPRFAQLNGEQARYLETFLRCRGMLNSVERELGISYPTARARLDAVLRALDLHEVREDGPATSELSEPVLDTSFEVSEPVGANSIDVPWESPIVSVPVVDEAPLEDSPIFEEAVEEPAAIVEPAPRRSRDEILTLLEKGEITPDEAKKELAQ